MVESGGYGSPAPAAVLCSGRIDVDLGVIALSVGSGVSIITISNGARRAEHTSWGHRSMVPTVKEGDTSMPMAGTVHSEGSPG